MSTFRKVAALAALCGAALLLTGCASFSRGENPEVMAFLNDARARESTWHKMDLANRKLRLEREEQARAWGLRTMPDPAVVHGARDMDEVLDRLYGTAEAR